MSNVCKLNETLSKDVFQMSTADFSNDSHKEQYSERRQIFLNLTRNLVAMNFDELDAHNIDSARISFQNKDILKSGFSVPCDFEMFPPKQERSLVQFLAAGHITITT